jgi:hypothetical protein
MPSDARTISRAAFGLIQTLQHLGPNASTTQGLHPLCNLFGKLPTLQNSLRLLRTCHRI